MRHNTKVVSKICSRGQHRYQQEAVKMAIAALNSFAKRGIISLLQCSRATFAAPQRVPVSSRGYVTVFGYTQARALVYSEHGQPKDVLKYASLLVWYSPVVAVANLLRIGFTSTLFHQHMAQTSMSSSLHPQSIPQISTKLKVSTPPNPHLRNSAPPLPQL